ncbi:MAG: ribosome biogenesis GTP-binding protein YihA/YsxC [Bacteroidota bacterium]
MNIIKSEFVTSSANISQCPKEELPEFAFIGRSNVGKSSLINMLTDRKALAKVSSKPGKTQLINHFIINESWYLVDLPGYGWAKVAKTEKAKWGVMIHDYLLERQNLVNLFVLVDSRLEPQKIDIEFINWLGEKQIPFAIVFTKTDKQSKNKTESNIAKYRRFLKNYWEELPPIFTTSSFKKEGRDEVLNFIEGLVTAP